MGEKVLYLTENGTAEKEITLGGETCNVEALTADKTLTATDAPIQMYTCTVNRIVYLPTTGLTVGQKFEIWNHNVNTSTYYLQIKQGTTTIDYLYAQKSSTWRWDGVGWVNDQGADNYSAGCRSNAREGGTAIGVYSDGSSNGTAIGQNADGRNYGFAGGRTSKTNSKGAATVAIGAYSVAERNREFVSTATQNDANKAQFTIQKYTHKNLATAAAAWQELFIDATGARLTIIASSVYNFRAQINAIDVTTLDVKTWEIIGTIKRNAANATSIVGTPTVTVIGADTATTNWDARVTADDTNESLKVEVKHDSTNNVRFSLNIIATETRV